MGDNLGLNVQSGQGMGAPVDETTVYESYDEQSQVFPGKWDVDARLCLQAAAPRPCNITAITISGQVSG